MTAQSGGTEPGQPRRVPSVGRLALPFSSLATSSRSARIPGRLSDWVLPAASLCDGSMVFGGSSGLPRVWTDLEVPLCFTQI